jgi:ABC-type proline/glycine betaine transport system permease subunit
VKDRDGRLVLEGDVTVRQFAAGLTRDYTGRQAYIMAETLGPNATPNYTVEMKNEVKVKESRKGRADRIGERKDPTVGPFAAPETVVQAAQKITLDELLDKNAAYDYNMRMSRLRGQLAREKAVTVGKALAEIHGRAAYSTSVLVLLLLGAGLGIIFRGGHFVSAFGLSFIPMLIVVVMIMTGRQLTMAGIGGMGILVIWLGYNIWPKIIIVALIVFFPLTVNTFDGLISCDPDLITMLKSMGANRWQIFTKIQQPNAMPFITSASKVAITFSVIGAVVAEWIGSDKGLGAYILQTNAQIRTPEMFSAIFITSLMGIVMFFIVQAIENMVIPWQKGGKTKRS